MDKNVQLHLDYLLKNVEKALYHLVPNKEPQALYQPIRYVLEAGGKRIRPLLTILSSELVGLNQEIALKLALSLEVFHNFTLVHDDIMDHAATRRGRATVHTNWDESTAILAGDLMMGMSYDLIAQMNVSTQPQVLQAFHQMVVRLCEGQSLDESFETRNDVTLDAYFEMISGKTGALLEACFVLPAITAQSQASTIENLKQIGFHIGRAFQIQDDLLDLTAESPKWGKKIGGDLIEGKKAFLLLKTLEVATGEELNWFQSILPQNGLAPELVEEAKWRMEKLGVLAETKHLIQGQYQKALELLQSFEVTLAQKAIISLIEDMKLRIM